MIGWRLEREVGGGLGNPNAPDATSAERKLLSRKVRGRNLPRPGCTPCCLLRLHPLTNSLSVFRLLSS